jgi:hypothetical protein
VVSENAAQHLNAFFDPHGARGLRLKDVFICGRFSFRDMICRTRPDALLGQGFHHLRRVTDFFSAEFLNLDQFHSLLVHEDDVKGQHFVLKLVAFFRLRITVEFALEGAVYPDALIRQG